MFCMRLALYCVACLLTACAPKPTDPFLSAKLEQVSKAIDSHYGSIVTDSEGKECRHSSKSSQTFWASMRSEKKVIDARTTYWPQNNKFKDEIALFFEAVFEAEEKETIAEQEPTVLQDNRLWYCLDADEAGRTWRLVSEGLEPLVSASRIPVF